MQTRGKFSDKYAQPVQPWMKGSGHRLMDLNLSVWNLDECQKYPELPKVGEFFVLDKVRREVAYFEWPKGMDVGQVQWMIQGHFGAGSVYLFDRVWVV